MVSQLEQSDHLGEDRSNRFPSDEPVEFRRSCDLLYPFKSAGLRYGLLLYISPFLCLLGAYVCSD